MSHSSHYVQDNYELVLIHFCLRHVYIFPRIEDTFVLKSRTYVTIFDLCEDLIKFPMGKNIQSGLILNIAS